MPFCCPIEKIFYKTAVLLAVFILPLNLAADEKYQITGQLSPSYETINYRNKNFRHLGGFKLSYNFGFEYKNFLSPVFSISTGLQMQNKGFRNIIEFYSSDSVKIFRDGALVINAYYLMAPIDLNWDIQLLDKTVLVISTGFSAGYLLRQEMTGKRIPAELEQINPVTGRPYEPGTEKIDWFKHFYFGWNGGFGITQYIKSKLVLTVQPMYTRQLNRLIDPWGPVRTGETTPKFDSYAIHFRLGYYFNDQISNYKKEF